MSIRELLYQKKTLNQVFHATLNPNGPGAVRIHMLPPKFSYFSAHPGILILNGQKILPINLSWAILFSSFLNELNQYDEKELSPEDLTRITEDALQNTKSIYPEAKYAEMKQDLFLMLDTLCDVAYGKTPKIEIRSFHLKDYAPYMKAPFCMDLNFDSATERSMQIINRCKEIGIPQLTYLSNDRLKFADLLTLLEQSRWFYTRLIADTMMLSETDCCNLRDAGLDSIQLTLYSSEESIQNQLAVQPNYKVILQNIASAAAADINITVHTPLCSYNTNYLQTLILLHELGVNYVSCSIFPPTESTFTDHTLQLSKKQLYHILDGATDYGYANGMEISFTTYGALSDHDLASLGLNTPPYDSCLTHMTTTSSGSVYAGEHSNIHLTPLGNLLKDPWRSIWYGTACTELRKQIAHPFSEVQLHD